MREENDDLAAINYTHVSKRVSSAVAMKGAQESDMSAKHRQVLRQRQIEKEKEVRLELSKELPYGSCEYLQKRLPLLFCIYCHISILCLSSNNIYM